jgi:N-acetylglutamate synthase
VSGVALLDTLIANAWPAVEDENHDGWRYRWAEGATRRANSALALGSNGNIVDLVAGAEAFYRRRNAPTTVQVSTASAPQELPTYLLSRGYRPTARTLVQSAETSEVLERVLPTHDVEITTAFTPQWLDAYWSVESSRHHNEATKSVYRDVLLVPRVPTIFASAHRGDGIAGVGQLVIERNWAGVQCMATSADHRRGGIARTIIGRLAQEASNRHIGHMYLAVMASNDPAKALYANIGFRTVHEYSYFTNSQE